MLVCKYSGFLTSMLPKKFWLGFKKLAENFGSKLDADERRSGGDPEVTSTASGLELLNIVSNNVAIGHAVQFNALIYGPIHLPSKLCML